MRKECSYRAHRRGGRGTRGEGRGGSIRHGLGSLVYLLEFVKNPEKKHVNPTNILNSTTHNNGGSAYTYRAMEGMSRLIIVFRVFIKVYAA